MLLCASSLLARASVAARIVATLAKTSAAKVEILHVIDKQAKVREMLTDDEVRAAAENLAKNLQNAGIDAAWRLGFGSAGPANRRTIEQWLLPAKQNA